MEVRYHGTVSQKWEDAAAINHYYFHMINHYYTYSSNNNALSSIIIQLDHKYVRRVTQSAVKHILRQQQEEEHISNSRVVRHIIPVNKECAPQQKDHRPRPERLSGRRAE